MLTRKARFQIKVKQKKVVKQKLKKGNKQDKKRKRKHKLKSLIFLQTSQLVGYQFEERFKETRQIAQKFRKDKKYAKLRNSVN